MFNLLDKRNARFINFENLLEFMVENSCSRSQNKPTKKRMMGLMRRIKLTSTAKVQFN